MRSKEYVLQLLDDALDDYFDSTNDVEKLVALTQISILWDLFELTQVPLRMQLQVQNIGFDIMMSSFEEAALSLE